MSCTRCRDLEHRIQVLELALTYIRAMHISHMDDLIDLALEGTT